MHIPGIHHVTAFARSPRANVDFYTRVLGLRMIKVTVNYDDPGTYHLYYADRIGSPGTVMTFFPHPEAPDGRHGTGQAITTALAVPDHAMDFWHARLAALDIEHEQSERFGEPCIAFADPDGTRLELIGVANPPSDARPWSADDVPAASAIFGFHSVTLAVRSAEKTIEFFDRMFDLKVANAKGDRTRLRAQPGGLGSIVDVQEMPDGPRGSFGPGTVHHVALRISDRDQQEQLRAKLIDAGANVTDIKNRSYFHSIYFREPGGVIIEIATDGPGFTVDESEDALGSALRLPPWLESDRSRIEAQLPPLDDAAGGGGVS